MDGLDGRDCAAVLCALELEDNVFGSCARPLDTVGGVCPSWARIIKVSHSIISDVVEPSILELVQWNVVRSERVALDRRVTLATLSCFVTLEIVEVDSGESDLGAPRAVGLDLVNRQGAGFEWMEGLGSPASTEEH